MKKRVTLSDVADSLGVSAITVSRVLRQPEKVSKSLRQKIELEIRKLGYYPDPAASILASKRTNIIGLVVPSLTNNVFADVLRGVNDAVEGSPYSVQIGNSRYSGAEECRIVSNFLMQKPAGLIVPGLEQTEECIKLLKSASCPVIQIMDYSADPIDNIIGFSHHKGGECAANHLINRGYRNIGFIGARMDPRTQKRLDGFSNVLKAQGIWDETRVMTTLEPSSVTLGGQMAGELFAQAPGIDAVFCNNDDLAVGVLFECQRRNIKVPSEFGICGFNDLEIMSQLNPPITSIATPRYEIGKQAIGLILDLLDAQTSADPIAFDLGFELMERASTMRQ